VPLLIRGPESQPAPSEYELTAGEAFVPESVTAEFDGSGAAGAFLACLSVYAQSGELLQRTFPADALNVGDVSQVTFAPLLRGQAAAAAAGSGLSVASIARQTVTVIPGAAFQPVDTTNFGTNDGTTFTHDTSGSAGHSGGTQGIYMAWAWAQAKIPFGAPAEPDASWMSVRAFSYSYPASQFTWQPSDAGSQAKKGQRFNPGQQWWSMYDIDTSYYPSSDISSPTQEYHVEVYNAGTQNMNFRAALTVIRLGDAVGDYPP
jgi:hypothetical protein